LIIGDLEEQYLHILLKQKEIKCGCQEPRVESQEPNGIEKNGRATEEEEPLAKSHSREEARRIGMSVKN